MMGHVTVHTSIGVWHPLYGVAVLCNVHDWYTRHLPYPALQVSVTGGYYITLVLCRGGETMESFKALGLGFDYCCLAVQCTALQHIQPPGPVKHSPTYT